MTGSKYYIGEDLKLRITLTAEGFNQDEDEYKIDLYCGNQQPITFTQDDIVTDDENNHYLLVPTENLSRGMMKMVVTAFVPDTDFASGIRKEVEVFNLGMIKAVI